ncbi:MAG: group 1 truncated hemoglobin [Akkermansiaceae bacterium]|nr:group 1 truncated hemoglobin [Akkermansiaceae bacterium]
MNDTPPENESIYDRIGGEAGIARLVDDFYARVREDPELGSYFLHVPMDKLLKMQREFFGAATGGPIVYQGRPLGHAHHPLGISRHEFKRFTDHLIDSLETFDITAQDVLDIIARVNLYADEICGDVSVDG